MVVYFFYSYKTQMLHDTSDSVNFFRIGTNTASDTRQKNSQLCRCWFSLVSLFDTLMKYSVFWLWCYLGWIVNKGGISFALWQNIEFSEKCQTSEQDCFFYRQPRREWLMMLWCEHVAVQFLQLFFFHEVQCDTWWKWCLERNE